MSIKNPISYADWYWKHSLDASIAFEEQLEIGVAPFFSKLLSDLPDIDALPSSIQDVLRVFAEPQHPGMSGFALGVGVETVDEMLRVALAPMMKIIEREYNKRSKETWLTSAQANVLYQRKKIPEDFWQQIITSEGYEDVLGGMLYRSQLPYPTIPDMVLYSRYHGNPDNVWGTAQEYLNIDPVDFKLWEWLGLQRLTTEQAHTAFRRGLISEVDFSYIASQIGWSKVDTDMLKETGWLVPNAMLLIQGNLHQEQSNDTILSDISRADINPVFAQTYLDGVLTKPASIDILNYGLRQDASLSGIEAQLRKIGIHPDYTHVYKELAYQIPPVADIITMAVREAFTPAIAARFGQYEDLPDDFVLYAGKKGLTKEWAARYWAAHWSLPSPQQGFEMLHRGIINEDELFMLMRALDIMPYWRTKLMQMSYRRLTRVDVRRMYREGVLDEQEVLEAYLQHGYAPENAKRMTQFTVKQTLSTLAKFTSADILSAYSKQMLSRSDARSLLNMIGKTGSDVTFILSTADYKRSWAMTEQQIKGIRNLYRQRIYTDDQTRDKLSKLNLPADRIITLMEQWYYEVEAEDKKTWTTAQTLKFIEDKIITKDRGIQELRIIGYDNEHIDAYMKAM